MTLPDDSKLVDQAKDLVDTMRATFDTPLNYRPVHAKGQLCKGTFTPSKEASQLSKAPFFSQPSTPLIIRYSTDTGLKDLPDNGDNASRGLAIRFQVSDTQHYDLITNTAFGFIVSTGEGFLEQFKAIKDDRFDGFLDANPHAKYFVENQSPTHSYSFATEQWHGIHAFQFVNAEGRRRFFRWRLVPWQGVMKYSKADAAKQGRNYQFDDLAWRLTNDKPIRYRVLAQLADEGDPTDDSTRVWPETREFVEMGEVKVERLWEMGEGDPPGVEQKKIFYNPMPHYIEGIEASADPLIRVRDAVYQLSGKIRREHLDEEVQQAVR